MRAGRARGPAPAFVFQEHYFLHDIFFCPFEWKLPEIKHDELNARQYSNFNLNNNIF